LQLEYGSELGRSVVNCKSPIFVCVLTRFHGGAYVVFSQALNPRLEIIALKGSYASVIGGTPAAAVVFQPEVKKRTLADERVTDLANRILNASESQKPALISEYAVLYKTVFQEKQAFLASEFDAIHSVERAREVGSIKHIINPSELRHFLVQRISDMQS